MSDTIAITPHHPRDTESRIRFALRRIRCPSALSAKTNYLPSSVAYSAACDGWETVNHGFGTQASLEPCRIEERKAALATLATAYGALWCDAVNAAPLEQAQSLLKEALNQGYAQRASSSQWDAWYLAARVILREVEGVPEETGRAFAGGGCAPSEWILQELAYASCVGAPVEELPWWLSWHIRHHIVTYSSAGGSRRLRGDQCGLPNIVTGAIIMRPWMKNGA